MLSMSGSDEWTSLRRTAERVVARTRTLRAPQQRRRCLELLNPRGCWVASVRLEDDSMRAALLMLTATQVGPPGARLQPLRSHVGAHQA